MQTVYHQADTRGHANHGWLQSYHTFSFAQYFNPERVRFGALRVLNDDTVAPGRGFGTHPHDNMEIISIPLQGALEHTDSMGNTHVIREHDVQVMSAGTGITHSEYNHSHTSPVHFLQIWVFPRERGVTPRYVQQTFSPAGRVNHIETVVSPDGAQGLMINQDAWFSLGTLEKGHNIPYTWHQKGNGVYVFVLEGEVTVAGNRLARRDGLGVWDAETMAIEATTDAEILLMEVPMRA